MNGNHVALGTMLCGAILYIVATATGQSAEVSEPVVVGNTEVLAPPIETPHPYPNIGSADVPAWTMAVPCLAYDGATWVKLHFVDFQLGACDYVVVADLAGNTRNRYDSTEASEFWALAVPGNTAVVSLYSNARGNDFGFKIDKIGYGFPDLGLLPTDLCGGLLAFSGTCCDRPLSSLEDIRCHSGTPFYGAGLPVARIVYGFDDVCWGAASGFLVNSQGMMLTSEQVIASDADAILAEAQFLFEDTYCGVPLVLEHYLGGPLNRILRYRGWNVIASDADCDFTLFGLLGGQVPARLFGTIPPEAQNPAVGCDIVVPQHPKARPKEISFGTVTNGGARDAQGACAGNALSYSIDSCSGSYGAPVLDADSLKFVAVHARSKSDDETCQGQEGAAVERIKNAVREYLLTKSVSGDYLFEDEINAAVNGSGSVKAEISCLKFEFSADLDVAGGLRGRFPGCMTLSWNPAEAVSGAGYLGCPPFTVYVDVVLWADPDENELEVEFDIDTGLRASASACLVSSDWELDIEGHPVIESNFDPTLEGATPHTPLVTREFGSATIDASPAPELTIEGRVEAGPTLVGASVVSLAQIKDVDHLVAGLGGISFAPDGAIMDCNAAGDECNTQVGLVRERQRYPIDVYIKPCVLPGSDFTFSIQPQWYFGTPAVGVWDWFECACNGATFGPTNLLCGPCTLPFGLWLVPVAADSTPLEIQVTVQGWNPAGMDAYRAFCEEFDSAPICNVAPGSIDQKPDVMLRLGRMGVLPADALLTDIVLPVDVDGDPDAGAPAVAADNPDVAVGAVIPGQTAVGNLLLQDVHGNLGDLVGEYGDSQFAIDFQLHTPNAARSGHAIDIGEVYLDGVLLTTNAGGQILLPPLSSLAGLDSHLLQFSWDVPSADVAVWDPDGDGRLSCYPSSYVEATLDTGAVPEFQDNNVARTHFTPALPDFVIEHVGTAREIGYRLDEHRWLVSGHTITLRASVSNLGVDAWLATTVTEPVPIFMVVQFIDSDGVHAPYTDDTTLTPVLIPGAALGASVTVDQSFHYAAPLASPEVNPDVYDKVMFTFTVNEIPSGGLPAEVVPECGRQNNVARVTLDYKSSVPGEELLERRE